MFRVPPAPAPYRLRVFLRITEAVSTRWSSSNPHDTLCDSLHGIQDHSVLAHTQVIVTTPNVHLILGVPRVRHRELGSQPIDVVKVTVRLVLVFLLQLGLVESAILKGRGGFGSGSYGTSGGTSVDGLSLSLFSSLGFGSGDGSGLSGGFGVRTLGRVTRGRVGEGDVLVLRRVGRVG